MCRKWNSAVGAPEGDGPRSGLLGAAKLDWLEPGRNYSATMRMSCSGCRVLRKGCSENCTIRPCLQWIKDPQSQANATVFLAKFYGRAGLMNLIDAGPEHLRPAIFRSLLYEACGRMVNPIYGSAGLLCSGSWHLCQAAVEAVLKGAPVMQVSSETAATGPVPPLHRASSYDIRHVAKEDGGAAAEEKVNRATRTRVKRSGNPCYNTTDGGGADPGKAKRQRCGTDSHDTPTPDPSDTQVSEPSSTGGAAVPCDVQIREYETALSLETAETSMVTSHDSAETGKADRQEAEDSEVELELTLGFKPFHRRRGSHSSRHNRAQSPTWSSSRSGAAEQPKGCDGDGVVGLAGDLSINKRLDLPA